MGHQGDEQKEGEGRFSRRHPQCCTDGSGKRYCPEELQSCTLSPSIREFSSQIWGVTLMFGQHTECLEKACTFSCARKETLCSSRLTVACDQEYMSTVSAASTASIAQLLYSILHISAMYTNVPGILTHSSYKYTPKQKKTVASCSSSLSTSFSAILEFPYLRPSATLLKLL